MQIDVLVCEESWCFDKTHVIRIRGDSSQGAMALYRVGELHLSAYEVSYLIQKWAWEDQFDDCQPLSPASDAATDCSYELFSQIVSFWKS